MERPTMVESALHRQVDVFFLRLPGTPLGDTGHPRKKCIKIYKAYEPYQHERSTQPFKVVPYCREHPPGCSTNDGINVIDIQNGDIQRRVLPVNHASTSQEDPWFPDVRKDARWRWKDLNPIGKAGRVLWDWCGRYFLLLAAGYVFACCLDIISVASILFLGVGFGQACSHPEVADNPVAALMVGILATGLTQQSAILYPFTAALLSTKVLPGPHAVFLALGYNIGTSSTLFLLSLIFIQDKDDLRRSIGGATLHYLSNLFTVFLVLPVEAASGALYRLSETVLSQFQGFSQDGVLYKYLTHAVTGRIIQIEMVAGDHYPYPATRLCNSSQGITGTSYPQLLPEEDSCSFLLENTTSLRLSDIKIAAILLPPALFIAGVTYLLMVKLLEQIFVGTTAITSSQIVNYRLKKKHEWLADVGAALFSSVIVFILQSSSLFLALTLPLLSTGVLNIHRAFPVVLGANIGSALAGLFMTSHSPAGENANFAMMLALFNVFFNLLIPLILFPIPAIRLMIVRLSKYLGDTIAKYRWFFPVFTILIFVLLPLLILGISMAGLIAFFIFGIPILIILALIMFLNILQQTHRKHLPEKLQTWDFLPAWMHTLLPYDAVVTKIQSACKKKCCRCSEGPLVKRQETKRMRLQYWQNSRIHLYSGQETSMQSPKPMR